MRDFGAGDGATTRGRPLAPEDAPGAGRRSQDLDRSGLHPRLQHSVAILDRCEERCRRESRLAVVLFERERFHHDVTGHAFELKGVDEPLWRHDLAVLAAEAVLVAIRVTLDEAPCAPGSDVHGVDDRRGVALSPPVGNVLRIGVAGTRARAAHRRRASWRSLDPRAS